MNDYFRISKSLQSVKLIKESDDRQGLKNAYNCRLTFHGKTEFKKMKLMSNKYIFVFISRVYKKYIQFNLKYNVFPNI